jgi:hypothetical protein
MAKSKKSQISEKKNESTSNQRMQNKQQISSSPPRKRRMASLNAEFFVHYCSSSYKDTLQTKQTNDCENTDKTIKDSTFLSATNSKRKRDSSQPIVKQVISKSPATNNTKQKTNENKRLPIKSENLSPPITKPKRTVPTKKIKDNTESSAIEITHSRPRREASMRATAMIIQTSEIEKSRFYSNKKEDTKIELNEPSEKDKDIAKVSPKLMNNNSTKKKLVQTKAKIIKAPAKNKKSLSNCSKSFSIESSPSSSTKSSEKVVLTEELITEHNKLNGNLGRGNNTFNNTTKMYIMKWASENNYADEQPFEPVVIPIETFGIKILDQPQYLMKTKLDNKKIDTQLTNSQDNSKIELENENLVSHTKRESIEKKLNSNESKFNEKLKIEENLHEKKDIPIDDNKSEKSSTSQSVHLVVDETSILIEQFPITKNCDENELNTVNNKEDDQSAINHSKQKIKIVDSNVNLHN